MVLQPANTHYIIGSTVGPHPYPDIGPTHRSSVKRKQATDGKENRPSPDYLVACVGGGSNAAGTIYHFLAEERVKIVLAEAGGKGSTAESLPPPSRSAPKGSSMDAKHW